MTRREAEEAELHRSPLQQVIPVWASYPTLWNLKYYLVVLFSFLNSVSVKSWKTELTLHIMTPHDLVIVLTPTRTMSCWKIMQWELVRKRSCCRNELKLLHKLRYYNSEIEMKYLVAHIARRSTVCIYKCAIRFVSECSADPASNSDCRRNSQKDQKGKSHCWRFGRNNWNTSGYGWLNDEDDSICINRRGRIMRCPTKTVNYLCRGEVFISGITGAITSEKAIND